MKQSQSVIQLVSEIPLPFWWNKFQMNMSNDKKKDIEKAFEFTQEANDYERNHDLWSASEAFGQASRLLQQL